MAAPVFANHVQLIIKLSECPLPEDRNLSCIDIIWRIRIAQSRPNRCNYPLFVFLTLPRRLHHLDSAVQRIEEHRNMISSFIEGACCLATDMHVHPLEFGLRHVWARFVQLHTCSPHSDSDDIGFRRIRAANRLVPNKHSNCNRLSCQRSTAQQLVNSPHGCGSEPRQRPDGSEYAILQRPELLIFLCAITYPS